MWIGEGVPQQRIEIGLLGISRKATKKIEGTCKQGRYDSWFLVSVKGEA